MKNERIRNNGIDPEHRDDHRRDNSLFQVYARLKGLALNGIFVHEGIIAHPVNAPESQKTARNKRQDESGFSDGKEGMDAGEDGGALGGDAAKDSRRRSYDVIALSGFGKAKIADVDKVGLLLYPSLRRSRIQAARSVILIWSHKELAMQASPNSFATLSLRKYTSFHDFLASSELERTSSLVILV